MVRDQLPAQVVETFNRTVLKNVILRDITARIKVKYIPNTETIISSILKCNPGKTNNKFIITSQ